MIPSQKPTLDLQPAKAQPSTAGVLWKSLTATAVVAVAIGGFTLASSGHLPWLPTNSGDAVTQRDASARETAFLTQPTLGLALVSDEDLKPAVAQMGLPAEERDTLLNTLQKTVAIPPPVNDSASPSAKPAAAAAAPGPAAEPQVSRLRLAWVTLWDTDAEDGDVVRLDSAGYSKTVTLTKQPVTIAMPVPADSVIKVTGIRDGEGGGITVGFASGAAQAVFPIMSVGQTLGLRVKGD